MTEAHILEVVYGLMNNMTVVMDGERRPLVGSKHLISCLYTRRRGINHGDPEDSRYVQILLMNYIPRSLSNVASHNAGLSR